MVRAEFVLEGEKEKSAPLNEFAAEFRKNLREERRESTETDDV
jgi:hypothetical protein